MGAIAAVTGCTERGRPRAQRSSSPPVPTVVPTGKNMPYTAKPVFFEKQTTARNIALTIDDGYDAETLDAYVTFAEHSGIQLTFSAIGSMSRTWNPVAARLRALIERGQVDIVNHTFSHRDQTTLSDAEVREDLERNDMWIMDTFRTSARPYWRPPNGTLDIRVQQIAADAGYPKTLTWATTLGDSALLTPEQLLANAKAAFYPGAIVLGHANHPTVTKLYPQLVEMLRDKRLTPVTVRHLLGA